MKVKIAIVDDDERMRRRVGQIAGQSMREETLLKIYSRGENILEDLSERFDIYILDVEMPGMSGLELAQRIRRKDKRGKIIFLTSYEKYALQGYYVQAAAYLLKEDMERELPDVLRRLEEEVRIKNRKCYIIETKNRLEKLLYDEILYVRREQKNCFFVMEQGSARERISLEAVFQKLDAPEFIYVDKGVIVNIRAVRKVVGNLLYLADGVEIPVSRSNIKKVKLAVRTYWKDQM